MSIKDLMIETFKIDEESELFEKMEPRDKMLRRWFITALLISAAQKLILLCTKDIMAEFFDEQRIVLSYMFLACFLDILMHNWLEISPVKVGAMLSLLPSCRDCNKFCVK